MARALITGTVPRRIRLSLPGWRDGRFDVRPGKASKTTYQAWKSLVQEAHREADFEVLDALADEVISFPEAVRLKREEGLSGLRDQVREAKRQQAIRGNFPTWMEEFLRVQPRKASKKHHSDIVVRVKLFLDWLVKERELDGLDQVGQEHWTKASLEEYVAWYTETHHNRWRDRMEAKWNDMEDPPKPTEREEEFRRDQGRKQNTANRHVNAVGAFSQWLLERGRIDHDPAVGVRITATMEKHNRVGDTRGIQPLEAARDLIKWARVFDKENPCKPRERPDALFWEWLVKSGATTWTEGVRLRPQDFKTLEIEDGVVPVYLLGTKGSARARHIYLPEEFANRILERAQKARIAPGAQIFPFEMDQGWRWWKKLRAFIEERAPDLYLSIKEAKPYDLRHTYAQTMLANDVDIYELMKLMGHKNIETTAIYLSGKQPARSKVRNALSW